MSQRTKPYRTTTANGEERRRIDHGANCGGLQPQGDFAKALAAADQAHGVGITAGMLEAVWRGDIEAGRAQQGLRDNAHAEDALPVGDRGY